MLIDHLGKAKVTNTLDKWQIRNTTIDQIIQIHKEINKTGLRNSKVNVKENEKNDEQSPQSVEKELENFEFNQKDNMSFINSI